MGISSQNPLKSLFLLSKEALKWSSDETMKSELEEACRVLKLDNLVQKYCGNEAREQIRASNPRHATNLMNYLCAFIDDPYLMTYIFELSGAFVHISKVESCARIIHNIILEPEIDKLNTCMHGAVVVFVVIDGVTLLVITFNFNPVRLPRNTGVSCCNNIN